MRLINVETFKLEEFFDGTVPPYAILSHTWGHDNEEVSFRDIDEGRLERAGLRAHKLEGCCERAKKDGLQYAWIDTCCIDKANAVELGEAINSMFQWYRNASICYTYLADVPSGDNPWDPKSKFFTSRWFLRGWTLQELLAPKKLHFYSSEWGFLGTKSDLSPIIEMITGIPRLFLLGTAELRDASVAQRMSWAAKRVTKRKEDIAYCLLGIFGVVMPMIYGEGAQAFGRLQQEIMRDTTDDSILAWGLNLAESAPSHLTEVVSGGVLAAAPSDFVNCAHVASYEQYSASMNSFDIFGGSLRIHLPLLTTRSGETYGLLRCGSTRDAEQVIGIPLEPAASRGASYDYIRPQGRHAALLPKPASEIPTKLIHIWKERQRKTMAATNRRYWFYIEASIETNLELIEVEPRTRWQKDHAMIATTTESNYEVIQLTTARFRSKNEQCEDFIIVLEFEAQRSQMDARCHVMTCSRETSLEYVTQKLVYMRQEAFGNQSASNGTLNLHVALRQEFVAGQPMFVVRLSSVPLPPDVTIDATTELQQLESEPKSMGRLGEENKVLLDLPFRDLRIGHQQDKVLLEEGANGARTPAADSKTPEPPEVTKSDTGASADTDTGTVRPLNSASAQGQLEVVKLLLEMGNDVNTPGKEGWTPLNSAANAGHIDVVRLLLDKGADPSIVNSSGWSPLSTAASKGHAEVVKLLLDSGGKVNSIPGTVGPLHSASSKGNIDIVRLLIEKGADVNIPSKDGWTALHSAANSGHTDVVKLLIDNGADVAAKRKDGWTPLSTASGAGKIDVVKLLIEKGAVS